MEPTKPLLDKLGVKAGSRASVLGVEDDFFWRELRRRTPNVAEGEAAADSDLIFLGAEGPGDLRQLRALQESIRRNGAIWVVYPKGRQELKETHVIDAAIEAGLVDVKVVKFSETHTALKLVIPVKLR